MSEIKIKTEECSDSENQSNNENNTQSCHDGYFEESSQYSNEPYKVNSNIYEESSLELESAVSSEKEDYHECTNQSLGEFNVFGDKNSELGTPKSKNNFKCGEIFWSISSKCYFYKCFMCPGRKFIGLVPLKHHHAKYHKLLSKKRKEDNFSKNDEIKSSVALGGNLNVKIVTSEKERRVALEQLESLFKRKVVGNQCFKCSKKFQTEKELLKHSKIHADKNPLSCIFCEKHFTAFKDLKFHQITHTGYKPFICKFANCGKTFTHSSDKKRHQAHSHKEK